MHKTTFSLVFLFFICAGFEMFSQNFGPNVALGKPTEQSSVGWGGYPDKAVDGNRNGNFDDTPSNWPANSVTHTGDYVEGTTEWWRVDLGEVYDLSLIRIYNRNSHRDRLNQAQVYVADINQEGEYRLVGELSGALIQGIENLGSARFIEVRQQGILSLAEVEVYVLPIVCPPVGTSCDDGNPNTINDQEDGDCNCVGVVVECEDLSVSYQVNGGAIINGGTGISVVHGDNVALFLNHPDIEFRVQDANNNIITNGLINNITSAQAGIYTILPNLNPVVHYVDSEEIYAENGKAANALDGDFDTFWHTEWDINEPPYPHEIVIDLRSTSGVSGLEYLPRQDGVLNGTIVEYEIYVSNSTTDWGTPVAFGTIGETGVNVPWGANPNLKQTSFPETQGRYVRLVAISAIDNQPWASAAEIRIIRQPSILCIKTIQIHVGTDYTFDRDNGWSPSDPNNGGIGGNDHINIISGNAVISSDILCNEVNVAPGAGLTLDENVTLFVDTLNLQSTSQTYASLILNGAINGTVNYELFTNQIGTSAGGGNDLISAPLSDVIFGSFATQNNRVLAASGNVRAFAPYNSGEGAYQNYNIIDNAATIIESGIGFRAATTEGDKLIFTGTVPEGQINVPITDASAGKAWNLIGNPYPSYLDFKEFFTLNSGEFRPGEAFQAIYGYTGASATWTVWNLATIADSAINDLIAPGQGFFVKSKDGGGLVQFTETMRTTGTSDDFIVGRLNRNVALSKLKLSNSNKDFTTSIYFIDGTTRGLDPGYDAATYDATKVEYSLFTNLLDNNADTELAIQSLPYDDFNGVVVPLGIKAKAGSKLTIGLDDLSTLPLNIHVYLEDIQNNTLTLLNDGGFEFIPTQDMKGTGRFNVHYSSKTLSIDDLANTDNLRIYATAKPKVLFIKGLLKNATTAWLYDINGRLVLRKDLDLNTTENTMDVSTISPGVYFVKLNGQDHVQTKKLIIE